MKKIISVFLATIILISSFVISGAEETEPLELVGDVCFDSMAVGSEVNITIQNNTNIRKEATVCICFYASNDSLLGVEFIDAEISAKNCKKLSATLEKDFAEAEYVKIFSWNDLENMSPLSDSETKQKTELDKITLGRFSVPSLYNLPYNAPKYDRLAKAKPEAFDPLKWPTHEIAYEDFEDDEFGVLEKGTAPSGGGIVEDEAYEGKRSLKTVAGSAATMSWKVSAEQLRPGDWLMLSCMAKSKGVEGGSGGRVRMSVNDGVTGKWKTEGNDRALRGDTDWEQHTVLIMVPLESDSSTKPESYTIIFQVDALGGTTAGEVWGDNFTLSKVLFHPMDTVLMSPAYKGIIKGENGINDIALRAYVNEENGAYDLSQMKFIAQITDDDHKVYMMSESDKVTNQMDVYFSSKDLPMGGDYYLECILTDTETGEVIQKEEWPLHKKESDFNTFLGYDEHGRITKNGKPTILVTAMTGNTYTDTMEDMIEAGCFDGISASGLGWHWSFGNYSEEQIKTRELIAQMDEKEMGISIGGIQMMENNIEFTDWLPYAETSDDIRKIYERIGRSFGDMPGMLMYYIADELNNLQWGPQLSWNRKIIESVDLNHPTYGSIADPLVNRPGVAAKAYDFLGYDPYPVTGKEGQNIALIYNRISEGIKLNPGRPVMLIGQMFWWSSNPNYERIPNQEEYRNMVFQALLAGADGIDNYSYRMLKENPGDAGWEAKWREYTDVLRDVKKFEPVILSLEPTPYYEINGGGEFLKTMSRRYDGNSYFFVVNTDPEEKTFTVKFEDAGDLVSEYSGEKISANSEGEYEVKMSGYGTEIFKFAQADYESSHAELKRFALSDAVLTGAEEENSEFYIKSGTTKVTYKAIISDKAKLYINGELRETSGTLSLLGLSELTIRIVSENGKNETQKTYSIKK